MANREVIDRALAELVRAIGERLTPAGWVVRFPGRENAGSATLTCATRAGVMATAQLGRAGFRVPDGWPVRIRLRLGVGYEPALDLSALLTVFPILDLVPNPVTAEHGGLHFELSGEAGISALAEQIAGMIDREGVPFAERFPGVESLIEETGAGRDQTGRHRGPARPDAPAESISSIKDLTLLAAAGRREEVASLLTAQEAAAAEQRSPDRRFARQLRRWLDAGGPPIPPAEQTLAQLPPRAEPVGPSWSEARHRFGSSRAAREAVRLHTQGTSVEELLRALEVEYAARGIETRPSDLAATAERLHAQQQPLGRARQRLRDLRTVASAGRTVVRFLRDTGDEERLDRSFEKVFPQDPEWLRPPDRAAYPVADGAATEPAAVVLDPGTDDLLAAIASDASRRAGDSALIDLWFSQEGRPAGGDPLVVAHIGSHRVGIVAADHAARFAALFRAAAFFDEDPLVTGTLRRPGNRAWYLEFRLPRLPEPSASTPSTAG